MLEYIGDVRAVEETLTYFCPYCKHRGRDGTKRECQIRRTMLTNIQNWTITEASMVEKATQEEGHCKWFESRDEWSKPPLPKDRDRR